MALFNNMGESSSPLFLTGDTALGLDIAPLQYYYKKKEEADADLAKKLTAKPELPEFKADALPGQKEVLESLYKQNMQSISKGLKKYGGLWGIYANSEEGKSDIAKLDISAYNLEMGETNKKRFAGASASVTNEGKSNVRYLDPNGRPMVIKDKNGKVRYATNEDMLQERSKDYAYDPDTGQLLAMDFNYTRGDSKTVNTEIAALASAAKSSSSSTASPVFAPQQDPNTGEVFYGSSIMQGHDAYNYISYVKQGGSSNKSQLNAAVEVLRTNLSKDSQDAIVNEIYDGAEAKRAVVVNMPVEDDNGKVSFKQQRVDYKKFDEDDVYRQQVIDAYTTDRVLQGVQPFVQTSSTYEESYNILGKAEGQGYGDKSEQELGLTQMIISGQIQPSLENVQGSRFVQKEDGTYEEKPQAVKEFYGPAVQEAYGAYNLSLASNPRTITELFGQTGMLLGGTAINSTGNTDPIVQSVKGFSYRSPMIQDESGNWRNINEKEQKLYEDTKAIYDSGAALSESQKAIMTNFGPKLYMDLNVNFGDEDRTVNYDIVNPETGQKEKITDDHLWIYDYGTSRSQDIGIREQGEDWVGTVSVPVNSFMGLQAKTDKQFQGNVNYQQQSLQEATNRWIQLELNKQNSNIQMSDNPNIEFQ